MIIHPCYYKMLAASYTLPSKQAIAALLFGIYFITNNNCNAQSAFSAGAQSTTMQFGTHQYVIGEMCLVHTAATTNNLCTQGFLQPAVINGFTTNNFVKPIVTVYPIPATNSITIQSNFNIAGVSNYLLFDASGKLLSAQSITQAAGMYKHPINITALAPGTYKVQITNNALNFKANYTIQKQ
jgi:hypothetical protein